MTTTSPFTFLHRQLYWMKTTGRGWHDLVSLSLYSLCTVNLTRVRVLDLSHNSLPSPPHNVWHSLPQLTQLSLAHNPLITALRNESFLSLDRLHRLDISGMAIASIEV